MFQFVGIRKVLLIFLAKKESPSLVNPLNLGTYSLLSFRFSLTPATFGPIRANNVSLWTFIMPIHMFYKKEWMFLWDPELSKIFIHDTIWIFCHLIPLHPLSSWGWLSSFFRIGLSFLVCLVVVCLALLPSFDGTYSLVAFWERVCSRKKF